eukprot:6425783-Pyramimonas_sp.AAC.2
MKDGTALEGRGIRAVMVMGTTNATTKMITYAMMGRYDGEPNDGSMITVSRSLFSQFLARGGVVLKCAKCVAYLSRIGAGSIHGVVR